MNTSKLLTYVAIAAVFLTACKKDGDTIINNYGSSEGGGYPKRTMMKSYGASDSSLNLRLEYRNNEIGKLEFLTLYDATSTPTSKVVILYDGSNRPVGYQGYTLPANTLNTQGTFKLDADGRIIQVVQRQINGDTNGIANFQYNSTDYQPRSYYYYDKTDDRNTVYEYFTYDKSGNLVKSVAYEDDGMNPMYKASETEAEGFGKGINGINQLFYYIAASASTSGYSSSAALFFSSYIPTTIRTQNYKPNGNNDGVSISNLSFKLDGNNNVVELEGAAGGQTIIMKF